MAQARKEGLSWPEDYYWGSYRPLVERYGYGILFGAPKFDNNLQQRHEYLLQKYAQDWGTLRDYGRFNLREYQAYGWVAAHQPELAAFYRWIEEQSCAAEAGRDNPA